jgi:O-antigen/teichoic acid export membrane protein
MKEKLRSTISYAVGPLLGIVSGPILARSLGPDGRGQFAAIMQPITIATTIAAAGVPTAITYFIAKGYSKKLLRKFALKILIVSTPIIFALLILYGITLSESQNIDLFWLILIWSFVFLSVIVEMRRSFLLGIGAMKRLDTERFIFSIARFFCIFSAWHYSILNAEQLSTLLLLSFALTSILLWAPKIRHQDSLKDISYEQFKKYMLSTAAVSISSVLAARIDQVLLPIQTTSLEVGYYAVGVTVSEVPLIFAILAGRSTLHSSSIGEPLSVQFQKARIFLGLGFLSTVIIYLTSHIIIHKIFGLEFQSSYRIVLVLLVSTLLSIASAVINSSLCGSGNELKAAIMSISALIPIGVLYLFLWGEINGFVAAWINVISQVMMIAIGIIFLRRANYVRTD